jgi:hypothetical protein
MKMLINDHAYSNQHLRAENHIFQNTGGVSQNNCQCGFKPAFRDNETGRTYRSCFANGRPAPLHLLDGLPDELVLSRNDKGHITAVRESVEAGFLCDQCFYTRVQAARHAA